MINYGYFIVSGMVITPLIYVAIKKYRLKKSPTFINNIALVDKFLIDVNDAKKDYFTYKIKEDFICSYKNTYEFFLEKPYHKINDLNVIEFKDIYSRLDELVKKWNGEFVDKELEANKDMLDNIDGKSLDIQQRKAVIIDEQNNLVLAGAGSGKTLTISAKVKYLVDKKNISSEEILLISFTKKASEEMYERISGKLGINIETKTFHKLGLEIITNYRNNRPDIEDKLDSIIDSYFKKNVYSNKKEVQNLIEFFGCYLTIPKDLKEFNNLGEYIDFFRSVNFETIKSKVESKNKILEEINIRKLNKKTLQGEQVKSLEELIIANFLYLNGIKYDYEIKYPFSSSDRYRKHYRPDFYLPDYNIYIEHFGITKDNRVPWLSEIEEKKYLDGIEWKRAEHNRNKTTLLETYSYYNKEGVLLTELERKLKKSGVKFKEQDFNKIYTDILGNKKDTYFLEFKKLIISFIGLFKSNGYNVEKFNEFKQDISKIEDAFLRQRGLIFIDIVKPIFEIYQDFLKTNNMIDFNDMINEATEIVKTSDIKINYKYIIIDEYQDISVSRFNLIKEIRNKTNAKVMCVGDDWQSIYRFAGSDIKLFTDFQKYLGEYELLKIENTYRNSQELINIASKFIMKNSNQLEKNLKSSKNNSNPIKIIAYDKEVTKGIMFAIEEIVSKFGVEAQITILGRNNFDIDVIEKEEPSSTNDFKIIKGKDEVLIRCKKYPKLKINFLTVHRSKGLEADNVIVINLENKQVGFPNKISDDPILSLVLTRFDEYLFAEERRLFYVALTRTKNTTYLIAPKEKQSIFCDELIRDFSLQAQMAEAIPNIKEATKCPRCQKGYLVVRESTFDRRKFLGCSNYPFCDLTFSELEIINNTIRCNICNGYMIKRSGKYGDFYGCTNYPHCDNTLKIQH